MAHFLDTNVLLYSISRNPTERTKRERAIQILEDDSSCLSVQVLQEFYAQATRTNREDSISHEIALVLIDSWTRFRIQEMTLSVFQSALRIRVRYGYSYWDSAVIAAAVSLRCERLYTEDLAHGQVVEGVTIVNPFR